MSERLRGGSLAPARRKRRPVITEPTFEWVGSIRTAPLASTNLLYRFTLPSWMDGRYAVRIARAMRLTCTDAL